MRHRPWHRNVAAAPVPSRPVLRRRGRKQDDEAAYEELQYDLGEWDPMGRRLLDGALMKARVPFHWDGAILVVPEAAREMVDQAFAQVEDGRAADAPPDDAELTTYQVGHWPHGQLDELDRTLLGEQIQHWWDDAGDLVVREADEARADEVLARFDEPDPEERDEDADVWDDEDQPDAQRVMTDLFVAADILRKNSVHPDAVPQLAAAAETAEHMRAPFGFSDVDWDRIVDSARRVRSDLERNADPDVISESAIALRDLLRPYV